MITRIFPLVLFLLTYSNSFDYHIEPDRCGQDTVCFVRKSCIPGQTDTSALYLEVDVHINGACDVIVQMKALNVRTYHILFQVNGSKFADPISNDGVTLKQGNIYFRCDTSNQITASSEFEIASFGKRQEANDRFIFCSFTARAKERSKKFVDIFSDNNNIPFITYITGTDPVEIKFGSKKAAFWTIFPKCDPELIISSEIADNDNLMEEIETTHMELKCEAPKKLKIVLTSGVEITPIKMRCVDDQWEYTKSGGDGILLSALEMFEAYCIRPLCSACESLTPIPDCTGCSEPAKMPQECQILECSKQWRLPGNSVKTGTAECRKSLKIENKGMPAWFFKERGSQAPDVEIDAGSCTEDVPDCWSTSNFILGCPAKNCRPLVNSTSPKSLSCPSDKTATLKLRYKTSPSDPPIDAAILTCDETKGRFYADSKNPDSTVPIGANVYCEEQPTESSVRDQPAAASISMELLGTAVGCSLLGVFIIAVIVFVIFCVRRKRARAAAAARGETIKSTESKGTENGGTTEEPKKQATLEVTPRQPYQIRKPTAILEEKLLKNFTESTFFTQIVPVFYEFSDKDQKKIVVEMLLFMEYDDIAGYGNGSAKSLIQLWYECTDKRIDAPECWELMWSVLKRIYEKIVEMDDYRDIGKRMKEMIRVFARQAHEQYGWTRGVIENFYVREPRNVVRMRVLAVRMLLWLGEPDIIAELNRLADLPIDQLQSPMRMVVFGYATRYLKRFQQLRTQLWPIVLANPPEKDIDEVEFGSLRQHIIYGLCWAKNDEKDKSYDEMYYSSAREIIALMNNYADRKNAFGPPDHLWAYRGMIEHVEAARYARIIFRENAKRKGHVEVLDELIKAHPKRKDEKPTDGEERLRMEWKEALVELIVLLAGTCDNGRQFDDFYRKAGELYYRWGPKVTIPFNANELHDRAENFRTFIADRKPIQILDGVLKPLKESA